MQIPRIPDLAPSLDMLYRKSPAKNYNLELHVNIKWTFLYRIRYYSNDFLSSSEFLHDGSEI